MSDVFGSEYAGAYNLLYGDKDYLAECDLLEELFRRYATTPVSTVLDLGCGTGNHAFPISQRGYDVVGVERADGMLAQAQRRLSENGRGAKVRFQQGDIRTVDLGRQFDAALMMFAVFGYQLENDDAIAALKTARRHLAPGGLLIFDFWYGPAVLRQGPSDRIKVIPVKDGKILRAASGALDTSRHTCSVHFQVWRLAEHVLTETDETHAMRYFFPQELRLLLDCCGFTLVRLGAFPDIDKEPCETTWNVLAVARAV